MNDEFERPWWRTPSGLVLCDSLLMALNSAAFGEVYDRYAARVPRWSRATLSVWSV